MFKIGEVEKEGGVVMTHKTLATLPIAVLLVLTLAVPALAANGDGIVESFSPHAVTVGTTNPLQVVFYNNQPGICIDEIIIEAPDTWTSSGNVSATYSLGSAVITNQEDDGTYSGLRDDPQSVRIVPANPICEGGRAVIDISGLIAPPDAEYSEFRVLTSDQNSNEPSSAKVRWPLLIQDDTCNSFGNQMSCSFMVRTTTATSLKIEYMHLEGTADAFTGKSWGAWARLDTLYVYSDSSQSFAVYMDSNRDGVCDPGSDYQLFSGSISAGYNTVALDYSSWSSSYDKPNELYQGYVADQKTQKYCTVATGVQLIGHEDSPKDPVPSNADTGLTGAVGTILNVDNPNTHRYMNVQLIDGNRYDVNEDLVPITAQLLNGIANVVDYGQLFSDSNGNKYMELSPTCASGVENVLFSSNVLTPNNTVTEHVGINAGTPAWFSVSPANGTEVVGGEAQSITVTVYDSCGNVISDSPEQPRVDFDLLSTCGGSLAQDPSMPLSSQLHEAEQTTQGVADMYLVTSCELCTHTVQVTVEGLGVETLDLVGVHGAPTEMRVTGPADGKMTADECVDFTVEVTDSCGNRITEYDDPISGDTQQWTSLVRVELQDDFGYPFTKGAHIQSTTFTEENIFSPNNLVAQGKLNLTAQGKLTNGAATVEVCGCSELGEYWLVANSDTLLEGKDDVDIINSAPSCIDVNMKPSYLYACQDGTPVDVSIVDTCGNIMVDQDCSSGPAKSCIDVSLDGTGDAHLSSDSVCVDMKTGFSDNLYLYRDSESCGEQSVRVVDAPDCCDLGLDALPQCEPIDSVTFIGNPAYIETNFEAVNPATQSLVDAGLQKVSEEVRDRFGVYDECGNRVTDFYGSVDVELKGEDCTSFVEVQCNGPEAIVADKVIIDNCASEPEKDWFMIEKNDLVVDKLAFSANVPEESDYWLYIYKETEKTAGFQTGLGGDVLVGKAPLTSETIIELKDHPFKPWQQDDQREGGVLIKAGDTRDFYAVVMDSKGNPVPCDDFGVSYMYYQDYQTADITGFEYGGVVRDGFVSNDNFNWIDGTGDSRNDDYDIGEGYGFGDKVLYNLEFNQGWATMNFRDLTAERVEVWTYDYEASGEVCEYPNDEILIRPQPEVIEFIEQPATQVVLLNHDKDKEKTAACDEWDFESNAVHFNLQVADGFQNPVDKKDIEVEMDYCLKWPFGTNDIEHAIDIYCSYGDNHLDEICDDAYWNNEYCFTKSDLKKILMAENPYHTDHLLFEDFFGSEITDWINWYFQNAEVSFYDTSGAPLPVDANGKQYVVTDANGQAEVYATSTTAGLFRIRAIPTALDADTSFALFSAGIPEKLDIAALPAFGVPADGEEEAMLLVRALDHCGNLVTGDVEDLVTVTAVGDKHGTEQVKISQDFDGNNNYFNYASGYLSGGFMGLLGYTNLRVLDDIPETATITASAPTLDPDTTHVAFQGAPVKLVITDISPSDRLPADGETGAWATVQVQDRNGNRVTGYLGDGFSGDPGDPWGFTDYNFENICVKLDDVEASLPPWLVSIDDTKFGWWNLMQVDPAEYCGNLLFGEGQIYITYGNPDCNHGGTIKATVYDKFPFQGQEYDENNLPNSTQPTQLEPDSATIDFVDPATQWNLEADNKVVLADGKSTAKILVQVENQYMDVRQSVAGNVYIGGTAAQGAVVSWNGEYDKLNPTSARFVTDPLTGSTYLELTSTTPGIAEVTVTGGDAYVCESKPKPDYMCGSNNECIELFNLRKCKYSSKHDLKPKTITVEFIEVADNELYLESGWNFVSTPYALTTPLVSNLFAPVMGDLQDFYGWDGATQSWVPYDPATSTIEPLNGYWVKMSSPAVITLNYASSTMPSIPTKQVNAGWDTVGLTVTSPWNVEEALNSIDNSYSHLIGWSAVSQSYDYPISNSNADTPFAASNSQMQPKKGYWIWVTSPNTVAGLTAM